MNYSIALFSNVRFVYSRIVGLSKDAQALVAHWHINYRTRRQLADLGSQQLQDIGVSRADALQELRKPFWKS